MKDFKKPDGYKSSRSSEVKVVDTYSINTIIRYFVDALRLYL